jgi:protein tyrosine/serine phosphatase
MRRIDLEGCFNFRDLGGWRTHDGRTVRWNKLYRADSVHLMTSDDVAHARDELGVRTLIDLRSDLEVHFGGVGALAESVTLRRHAPFRSRPIDAPATAASDDRSPDAMAAQYLGILEHSSDLIVDAVTTISSDDGLPAVFFCAAGKDRTGVLSAVVLGSLGVTEDDIVEDYVLSAETIDRVIGRFGENPNSPDMYRDFPPSHFAPVAETMHRVIAHVRDRYGSFGDYVLSKGLSSDRLEALRASLLT